MTEVQAQHQPAFQEFVIDRNTEVEPAFQAKIEQIDLMLREKHGMRPEQTAVGILDLKTMRLGMVRPNLLMYGASVPKISILLAFFALNPSVVSQLADQTRHELG